MNPSKSLKSLCIALTLLAATLSSAHAGIIHRWSFSETTGTNIADSVGTANGSVFVIGTNADFAWTNGMLRLAGGLRTNADYAQFPAGLLHGGLSNVTIELWATPRVGQTWSRLFDFGPGNNTQAGTWFLSVNRGGTALNSQRFEYGAPAVWTVDTGVATTAGQQYYYVATWSAKGGTNGGGQAQWYRDGVLIGSADTGTSTISNVNDAVLWLGRSQYTADNSASVDYNEMRMYNFVLGPNQIMLNLSNGPGTVVLLPPAVTNDAITLNPGAQALINVLANDSGISSAIDPNTLTIVTPPGSGSAVIKTGGKILYTHNGGPGSSDSFTYRVQDVSGLTSAVATVSITVSPNLRLPNTTVTVPNTPPVVSYQVVDAYPGLTITQPLALRPLPGTVNTNLLFIVERRGFITYLDTSLASPTRQMFMNISNQLVFDNSAVDGELGLLSLDFHPNFWSNGVFFVSYTAPGGNPYHERVSRFVADAGIRAALQANTALPNLVDTNSQQMLFDMTKRAFNHNGADLHFGNDGYLYISMGDEGDQYNMRTNAQRLDLALWAGMLRIDVDKKLGSLEPKSPSTGNDVTLTIPTDGLGKAFYSIPSDNPFLGFTADADGRAIDTNHLRGEFYAIGMRHPWRFSVDKPTGDIWVGIVGQDMYEGVYKLKKGGNYGWPYYEAAHLTVPLYGTNTHPGFRNPPPGFVLDGPLFEYPHNSVGGADPSFAGLDVNGSYFYRGTAIPELTNAYLFGDFDTGGNVWAMRISNNVVTVERLTGMTGLSAFGADPRTGEVLMCNYLQNKIQKLVKGDVSGSTFPSKLSDTGIFADLGTLTPNPGIVSYSPNVTFWSDYALKTRWFTIPDLVSTVNFTSNGGWGLPTGMKWIKHFDLELNRGNPATKKRIETRVLVKTAGGVYGVSYKWNDTQDEAFLVGDSGDLFQLTVTNNGVPFQQDWEIPSRSSCLSCHTPVGGFALTFNTREMNKFNGMNGVNGNQIQTMSGAGYFSAVVPNVSSLPAFAVATDTNFSLEYRVRSYLAVNCVQCHQPGGAGQGNWNARPELTLAQTQMINGTPVANDGGNPLNKIIVPGDTNHSVLLMRLENTNGFSRMPPLATHQLDLGSIALVQNWITQELPGHLTYAQWITNYPSLVGPAADPGADPDGDGANNYFEYLTGTNPTSPVGTWKPTIQVSGGQVYVGFQQLPNLGVVIDVSTDLATWTPWDVPGNQPFFSSYSRPSLLSGPVSTVPPFQFFRARLIQP